MSDFDILHWLRTEAILPDEDLRNQDVLNDPTGYPLYSKIASLLQPLSILEIGTHYGAGLCAFLAGYPHSDLLWIDNESYHPGTNKMAVQNVVKLWKTLGVSPLSTCYFPDKLKFAEFRTRPVLVHVDADHKFNGALADMSFALALHPRYILVDDMKMPPVNKAVNWFSEYFQLPYKEWDTLRGWAAFALDPQDFERLPDVL